MVGRSFIVRLRKHFRHCRRLWRVAQRWRCNRNLPRNLKRGKGDFLPMGEGQGEGERGFRVPTVTHFLRSVRAHRYVT